MEDELLSFVRDNNVLPFGKSGSSVKFFSSSVFKTRDARIIFSKVISDVSKNFVFSQTKDLLAFFSPTSSQSVILERQKFFNSIPSSVENESFEGVGLSRKAWRPPYSVIVVTEDEGVFVELQRKGCPVKLLLNDSDVLELEDLDVVQVLNCENYRFALEKLPQTVFLNSVDEAYLERFVELLSEWGGVIKKLKGMSLSDYFMRLVLEVDDLLFLTELKNSDKLSVEKINEGLEVIREEIGLKVKELTVSGSSLMEVFSKGVLPDELKVVVNNAITKTGLPHDLFLQNIPVSVDEAVMNKLLRAQEFEQFTGVATKIQERAGVLKSLPETLSLIGEQLLLHDLKAGVKKWVGEGFVSPVLSSDLSFSGSKNLFLRSPQPINFSLSGPVRCSVLTGANSGGKTTLLEHVLQGIVCLHLGLPFSGSVKSPLFSNIYYFAKNKGSASKGAFETLLSQLSSVRPGGKTLILADEIEAVTEPGVAGRMINLTLEYFLGKGCFLVFATHLGHEIVKNLPSLARVDGIEAKGLSADNELLVDHNPVLGRLANSTPELIIEKMAKVSGGEYFNFLNDGLLKK